MKDSLLSFSLPGAALGAVISIIPLWGITFLVCPGICDSPVWLDTINLTCGLTLLIGALVGGMAGRKSLLLSSLMGLLVGIISIALNITLGWQISEFERAGGWRSGASAIRNSDTSNAAALAEYWLHPLNNTVRYKIHPDIVTVDGTGKVWIETENGIVSYFDGNSWQDFSWTESGLCSSLCWLSGLEADGQGRVWFAVEAGIAGYDGENWQIFAGDELDRGEDIYPRIQDIFIAPNGELWVESQWHHTGITDVTPALSHFDGTRWETYSVENGTLPDVASINSIAFDQRSRPWVGGSAGLSVFEDGKMTLYTEANSGLVNNNIEEVHIDSLGRVWLKKANAFDHGLQMFDGSKWETFPQSEFKCPHLAMASGDSGMLWVGSCDGSVMSYDSGKWVTHNMPHSSPREVRSAIALLAYINEKVSIFRGDYDESDTFSIEDIEIDEKGRAWVMSSESLHMYDGENWITMNEETAGYSWENGGNLFVDASGRLWVFSPGRVAVFDDG